MDIEQNETDCGIYGEDSMDLDHTMTMEHNDYSAEGIVSTI